MNKYKIAGYVCIGLGLCSLAVWAYFYSEEQTVQLKEGFFMPSGTNVDNFSELPTFDPITTPEPESTIYSVTIDTNIVPLADNPVARDATSPTFDTDFQWSATQLTNVLNQGQCGTCWAMAICKMLADRLAIQSQNEYKFSLSTQQMVSCSLLQSSCTTGVSVKRALDWLSSNYVIPLSEYEYVSGNASILACNNTKDSNFHVSIKPGTIRSIGFSGEVGSFDHWKAIQYMKSSIKHYGPIVANIIANDNLYDVANDTNVFLEDDMGGTTYGYHAIIITGWHDPHNLTSSPSSPLFSFKSWDATAYWICVNSWGSDWPPTRSEAGAFRVQMYNNTSDIEKYVFFANPELKLVDVNNVVDTGGDDDAFNSDVSLILQSADIQIIMLALFGSLLIAGIALLTKGYFFYATR